MMNGIDILNDDGGDTKKYYHNDNLSTTSSSSQQKIMANTFTTTTPVVAAAPTTMTTTAAAAPMIAPSSSFDSTGNSSNNKSNNNNNGIQLTNFVEEYKNDDEKVISVPDQLLTAPHHRYHNEIGSPEPHPPKPKPQPSQSQAQQQPMTTMTDLTQSPTFVKASKRERDILLKWQSESPESAAYGYSAAEHNLRMGNSGLYMKKRESPGNRRRENRHEHETRTILMDAIAVDVVDDEESNHRRYNNNNTNNNIYGNGGSHHGSDFARSDLRDVNLDGGNNLCGDNDGDDDPAGDYYSSTSFQRFRAARKFRLLIWMVVSLLIVTITLTQITSKARTKRQRRHQDDNNNSDSNNDSKEEQAPPGTNTVDPQEELDQQKLKLVSVDDWVDEVLNQKWSTEDDLNAPQSPQMAAIEWLTEQGNDKDGGEQDLILWRERYAAAVLYFAWKGENWYVEQANFLTTQPSEWSICQWFNLVGDSIQFGLDCTCDNVDELDQDICRQQGNARSDTVKRIQMSGMNLRGSIPQEIYLFHHLVELDLNHNHLQGPFPILKKNPNPNSSSGLERLRHLALADNQLNGPILSWLKQMPNLRFLDVSQNTFQDHLTVDDSDSLSAMAELHVLNVNYNRNFKANLKVFQNLTQLRALLLADNVIHGELSHELLERLPNLEVLDLSKNDLEGTILGGTIGHPTLTVLDLHRNQFAGPFPTVDPSENNLRYLSLRDNKLKGSLPSTLLELTDSLYHLDIARNLMTGTMPTMISKFHKLEYLDLSFNKWTSGNVPVGYGNLENLKYLALQETNRGGTLPDDFFQGWNDLQVLDIGRNLINGALPSSLGPGTPSLTTAVLYHNAFDGELVPLQNAANLESIIANGGNDWFDNAELQGFCNADDFPNLDTFVIRPCTNNEEDSGVLLPFCSCCTCCPNVEESSCSSYFYFTDSDNAWDTAYTRFRFRQREVMLTDHYRQTHSGNKLF